MFMGVCVFIVSCLKSSISPMQKRTLLFFFLMLILGKEHLS